MDMLLARALDLFAIVSALAAAWLWHQASSNVQRRLRKGEDLDHRDLNRIVVAMNRTQLLNRRAALATAASALAFALKTAHDMLRGS